MCAIIYFIFSQLIYRLPGVRNAPQKEGSNGLQSGRQDEHDDQLVIIYEFPGAAGAVLGLELLNHYFKYGSATIWASCHNATFYVEVYINMAPMSQTEREQHYRDVEELVGQEALAAALVGQLRLPGTCLDDVAAMIAKAKPAW